MTRTSDSCFCVTSAHTRAADERFLSPLEARELLGVSRRTFQRYVERGLIAAHHRLPNGHARFAQTDVTALAQHPERAAS